MGRIPWELMAQDNKARTYWIIQGHASVISGNPSPGEVKSPSGLAGLLRARDTSGPEFIDPYAECQTSVRRLPLVGRLKQNGFSSLRTFRLDVCETFARYRFRALRRAARINCSDDHYRTTDLFNRQTGFL
ncbi:hypothetical protein JYG38_17510 [Pseudomonas rhodesiae]|uniref:hypothetical protein n=1 Tax=Pseudomonas rhodesiae TaxID=76760 RepID=UPI001BCF4D54|nr:hypothetical protein [Pseudomonas rhodesiae]QVN00020.1 hypothetical protein JYG38_17510 [Pseudomonas rhodesiae]